MKIKLLRKIRNIGSSQIEVYSISYEDGISVGMSVGMNNPIYSGLFMIGDTEQDVKNKAIKIYYKEHEYQIKKEYYKYSRKNKQLNQ